MVALYEMPDARQIQTEGTAFASGSWEDGCSSPTGGYGIEYVGQYCYTNVNDGNVPLM